MNIYLLRRRFTGSGGAERFTMRLASHLAKNGLHVIIVAEEWPEAKDGEYEVVLTGTRSAKNYAVRCLELIGKEPGSLVFSLERTLKQDIFRAGDGVHACWLRRRSKFQNAFERIWNQLDPKHRAIQALEKEVFSISKTKHVVANSAMVKREILENFNYPESHVSVIHSGVNLHEYSPLLDRDQKRKLRSELEIPHDAVVWSFVGSGFERKGLKWAIQIAARQKEKIHLLVLGKGNRNPYRSLAGSEGLGSRLVFATPGTPVLKIYQASDAFILPTIYDPCANATLEAAACGLPVITSTANGAHEFIPCVALDDLTKVDEAAERTREYAAPLRIAENLPEVRERLNEDESWHKLMEVITKVSQSAA